ncbi:MAG: 5-formyltetrahydrofolate cyclo-ligase [Methanoregulaceae archaeon]|nr:5-formyltetrahydrofolate cyclo-ligase [Methanoregulaceae archaeon]
MSREKRVLREHAKEIRCRLSREEIEHHSSLIEHHLRNVIDGESPILVYASKANEVDTRGLIASLLASGTGVVVPIIERESRTLRLSYLRDPSFLVESTFSVPEPLGCEIPASPADIRIVVVPMIAFDRNGHRLGYGAGYYDRFLSCYPHMKKIGIAFSCLELPEIPGDENDVAMDLIVTEKGIIEPR